MKALVFGEILWDVYPDGEYIGGAPLNFAAHFVRCGGKACINSAVGTDKLGERTLETVKDLGVGVRYISQNEKPTGRCMVELGKNQIPVYRLLEDAAYDCICPPKACDGADVLYFGTLALRSKSNMECLEEIIKNNSFGEIFVDINIRKPFISRQAAKFALERASILKISAEERDCVAELAGIEAENAEKTAQEFASKFKNIKLVLITAGADGALAYDAKTGETVKIDAKKVEVVSTVGAGDSFSAAFLAKYLMGKSLEECLKFASEISGFVVSKKEAVPEYELSDGIFQTL